MSYPLHLCGKFVRRWSAKAVQDVSQQQSSPQRADSCTACGRLVSAPAHLTYLPTGKIVHQWRCPACRNSWQITSDSVSSTDIPSSRSEHLRGNAEHCLTLEDGAADDASRKQLRRMGDGWLALAETQYWLDGVTPPLSRPQPQIMQFDVAAASRGELHD